MRKEHPYYESERRRRSEEFSLKACAICILGFIVVLILGTILG